MADTNDRDQDGRTGRGPADEPRSYTGTGIVPAVVFGLLVAAAVIAFVAQNGQGVALEWLWLEFETSPAVLVLVALFVGVVADEIAGLLWRRSRRRRLHEREDLQRLREQRAPVAPPGTAGAVRRGEDAGPSEHAGAHEGGSADSRPAQVRREAR